MDEIQYPPEKERDMPDDYDLELLKDAETDEECAQCGGAVDVMGYCKTCEEFVK